MNDKIYPHTHLQCVTMNCEQCVFFNAADNKCKCFDDWIKAVYRTK